MVGRSVKYQLASGDVIDAIVMFVFPPQDVQPAGEGVADEAELERARQGRRQVNLMHVSTDPTQESAHGRASVLAKAVPHRDDFDAEIDRAGFWYEGGA